MLKLDILAIGVHPDDVELGCSGTLIMEKRRGKKVGVVDLTQGELGTRGTIETRYEEAAKAAMIMGLDVRENLKMRDGFFRNDEEHQLQLIRIIRKYRPEVVLANALRDRHPDHGRAGHLISDSCYFSGLMKIETLDEEGRPQERWRPKYVFHYLQDRFQEPDLIFDISEVFEQRMEAIRAYGTQFHQVTDEGDEPQTYISTPEFIQSVEARARVLGKRIGVKYGEGYISEKKIGIGTFESLVLNET